MTSSARLLGPIAASARRRSGGGGAVGSYRSEVMADSPVAYWWLDEASGTFADHSGNALTGTAGGSGLTYSQAAFSSAEGTAVGMGGSAYIDIGANAVIDITGDWTYECWVKLNSLGDQFMMNKFYEGHEAPGFVIDGGTHKLRLMMVAAGATILLGSTVLSTGVWYHCVATRAGNVFSIYLNGALETTVTTAIAMSNDTRKFRLGAYYSGSFGVNGVLDECAVYTHAVSATRIATHYAARSNASVGAYATAILADSPAAFWPLDDASGTTARDASGNSHDGTYSGDVILAQPSHISSLAGAALFNSVSTTGVVTIPSGVMGLASSTAPKSFECWFKTTDHDGPLFMVWASNGLIVISLGLNVSAGNGGNGNVALSIQDDGAVGYATVNTTAGSYADGAWHHVVVTRSAAHVWKCYVDGNSTARFTLTDTFTSGIAATSTNKLNGGATVTYVSGDRGYITGTLQAFAVYNAELTTAQIAAHFAAA